MEKIILIYTNHFMPIENLLVIIGLALSNLVALVAGIIRVTNRLTKIETNLQWVIKGCGHCSDHKEP